MGGKRTPLIRKDKTHVKHGVKVHLGIVGDSDNLAHPTIYQATINLETQRIFEIIYDRLSGRQCFKEGYFTRLLSFIDLSSC